MKHYGIEIAEGSDVVNLTIDHNSAFPGTPNVGELFFKTGSGAGLYFHDGTNWNQVVSGNTTGFVGTVTTPSSSWSINHNLNNSNLQFTVYVDDGASQVIISPLSITVIDANNIQIDFTKTYTGKVVIIAVL
jgi:hypothetical protein